MENYIFRSFKLFLQKNKKMSLRNEEEILKYWDETKAFEKSLDVTSHFPEFVFQDGPPFATGLPHYGHLVASAIKDIIPRYKSQTGFNVKRNWGWDCVAEGTLVNLSDGTSVPIENLIATPCINVLGFNESIKGLIETKSTHFFDQKEKHCIKVTLEDGTELICTPEHKILTQGGYVDASKLIEQKDLNIVTFPCFPKRLHDSISDWKLTCAKLNLKYDSPNEIQKSITFARLLGYLITDGTLFFNTSKNIYVACVYLGHELDAQQFVQDIGLVCGYIPKYRFSKNVYVVDIPMIIVQAFLSLEGFVSGKRTEQTASIPTFLTKPDCPLQVKQEFLGGLFGGDGHTSYLKHYKKNGKYSFGYVRFSQSKISQYMESLKIMFADIIKLLNDVGVKNIALTTPRETSGSKKNVSPNKVKKEELSFIISKKSMRDFAKFVGFRYCAHKTLRLYCCISYLGMKETLQNPYLCLDWLERTHTKQWFSEKYALSRKSSFYPHSYSKVKSIDNIGIKKVYDICVPATANFVANGIVVHNCHGLPIEFEIEKKLGIKTRQQVIDFGIDNYNEACRAIVMEFRSEWKHTIRRLGRWVDMDNDYKTMDLSFMESVWWVFSQLYKKDLVYRGYKVCPFSIGCGTPLSHFEANNDNYKDTLDYSIVVSFDLLLDKLANVKPFVDKIVKALVWTTTPWTLPSNLMLCVNPNFTYELVQIVSGDTNEPISEFTYLIASSRKDDIFRFDSLSFQPPKNSKLKVVGSILGKDLVGIEYQPMFSFFVEDYGEKAFKICADEYVQETSGTGIVHQAPAFGEDDYRVCLKEGLFGKSDLPPCPINDNGIFVEPVTEWQGLNVKDSEDSIVSHLKQAGHLFSKKKELHSYPFCWRSDTPLIYKVCDSWFIKVEHIREELQKNNQQTNWVPQHIRDHRFHNWLGNANDWCISRNRFWGTPIPLWISKDGKEIFCPTSVRDIEIRCGLPEKSITDIHLHHLSKLRVMSENRKEELIHCGSVFDCWLESGSVPYASHHYPFSTNEVKFADFIAEGLDQTRGWFYTLAILGTHLFGRFPFKNVIVNGIVQASDGAKMSKRKKNYDPPDEVLNTYGADALRLYLIDTPVVTAGDIKFNTGALKDVVRKYHLMINNVVKFYDQMVGLYEHKHKTKYIMTPIDKISTFTDLDILDNWILQCLNELTTGIHSEMEQYRLNGISSHLFKFIDRISRWYMNLNKNRFKKCERTPLDVLGNCLYHFAIVCAPFTPFIAESVYLYLKDKFQSSHLRFELSVHLCQIPKVDLWKSDGSLLSLFDTFSDAVDLIRVVRTQRKNPSVKLAFNAVTIVNKDITVINQLKSIEKYIKEEMNIDNIEYDTLESNYVTYQVELDVGKLKKRESPPVDKKIIGKLINKVKSVDQSTVKALYDSKLDLTINVDGKDVIILYDELLMKRIVLEKEGYTSKISSNNLIIQFDHTITQNMMDRYYAKLFNRFYQDSRKEAGLLQSDEVEVAYKTCDKIADLLKQHSKHVSKYTFQRFYSMNDIQVTNEASIVYCKQFDLEIGRVDIFIIRKLLK
jgi:isoleucyl-tRNA synthetase